jgi:fructosamine-3-kinase
MIQVIQGPSVKRLMGDDLRIPVEQTVSAYLNRTWQVTRTEDKTDAASHPAAILSDGAVAVFVKLGEGDRAVDMFTQELAGLRLLSARASVLTPTGIGIVPVENGALLILTAVALIERGQQQWRQMGQALAQIHQVQGQHFGLEHHCYWGSLYQDNRPLSDWPEFFWTRRMEPRLRAAVDSGNLPLAFVAQVEQLGRRLTERCGPPVRPTLLHGDAHQNNFLSTAQGPVLIDPSVYYGHPEMDLAYLDFFAEMGFFAPTPAAFYAGYGEVAPVADGFDQRRNLWRIPAWLAMVQVDGPQHMTKLSAALQNYV